MKYYLKEFSKIKPVLLDARYYSFTFERKNKELDFSMTLVNASCTMQKDTGRSSDLKYLLAFHQ